LSEGERKAAKKARMAVERLIEKRRMREELCSGLGSEVSTAAVERDVAWDGNLGRCGGATLSPALPPKTDHFFEPQMSELSSNGSSSSSSDEEFFTSRSARADITSSAVQEHADELVDASEIFDDIMTHTRRKDVVKRREPQARKRADVGMRPLRSRSPRCLQPHGSRQSVRRVSQRSESDEASSGTSSREMLPDRKVELYADDRQDTRVGKTSSGTSSSARNYIQDAHGGNPMRSSFRREAGLEEDAFPARDTSVFEYPSFSEQNFFVPRPKL
jgi:hypothetical protein